MAACRRLILIRKKPQDIDFWTVNKVNGQGQGVTWNKMATLGVFYNSCVKWCTGIIYPGLRGGEGVAQQWKQYEANVFMQKSKIANLT